MRNLIKGAVLLFAGMALLGTSASAVRAEVIEETKEYRLCHTGGWYYYAYEDGVRSSKRDGIKIFGYDGPETDLVLPETLDGYAVTAVSENGSESDTRFNGISERVKSITIHKNINFIDTYPDVESVKKDLYTVRYYSAMSGLKNLERYEVSPENMYYQSKDGALFSKDGDYLIHYPPQKKGKSYETPISVNYISMFAFKDNRQLQTVVLPEHISVVGSYAFSGCTNLKKVFVPSAVKEMNYPGFENCTVYCEKGSYAQKRVKELNKDRVKKIACKTYAAPSKLKSFTAKVSESGKATFSWKPASGASGYEISKSKRWDQPYETLKLSISTKKGKKTCQDNLKGELGASYEVRAYKKAGPGKVYGKSSYVTLIVKPETVKGVKVKRKSDGTAEITWKSLESENAPGCGGYIIYRRDSKSKKYKLAQRDVRGGGSNKYTDQGLESGKTYYYKVRAYNSYANKKSYGEYSKPAKAGK